MANELHPMVLAADTTNLQESGMSSLGSAITQGLPAAAASGLISIWNTFQPTDNEVDVSRYLRDVDASMGDYYDTHKNAVDMVGFVGTSFIPGTAGIKALKLASSGEALGAVGRGLGMAATKKAYYLEQAMQEIGRTGGAVPKLSTANRLKGVGWEVADQALQGLAFEAAVAGTMNDSPVFDNSTLGDFAWNMTLGTVLAGAIGGPLASIGARGILKSVSAEVEAAKRTADVVFDYQKLGLMPGTSTLLTAENMAKLPDEFVNLKVSYKYDGVSKSLVLTDSAQMLQGAKTTAVRSAEQNLALQFNDLANGNAALGQAMFGLVKTQLSKVRAASGSVEDQIQAVHGLLNNLKSISHADLDKVAIDAKKFYVTIEPESLLDLYSKQRVPGKTGKTAYQLAADATRDTLKTQSFESTGFPTLKAAWRSGEVKADVLLMPNGRAAINPASKQVTRVFENTNKVSMWVDLQTGNVTPETALHFADIIAHGKLFNTLDSIGTGNKVFRQAATALPDFTKSAVEGSARWAWVSKFGGKGGTSTINDLYKYTGGTIDSLDLPVLSRALELRSEVAPEAVAKFMVKHNDETMTLEDFVASGNTLVSQKYDVLQTELAAADGGYDLKHIAAHLNTTQQFVEDAIAKGFVLEHASDVAHLDLPTAAALAPKTARATWDFTAVAKESGLDPLELYKQNFGPAFQVTQALSRQYNLTVREEIGKVAATTVLGEHAANFPDAPKDLSKTTTQSGAGAGLGTASNADYGDAGKLYVQETGKQVSLATQRIKDAEIGTIAPQVNAIKASQAAATESAGIINALRKSKYRYVVDPEGGQRLVSTELANRAAKESISIDELAGQLSVEGRVGHVLPVENKETMDLLVAHTGLNDARQEKFIVLHNAAGQYSAHTAGVIYVPPISTTKYPYHVLVATKPQIGIASDVTMLTARTEEELRQLVSKIDNTKYDVHYKKDTEMYHKIKGDYDYQQSIHESRINSELARDGKLADHFPSTTAESVLTDLLEFHSTQTDRLVRTAVQVKDRQFFGEMQFLSDNYRKVAESTATGVTTLLKKKVADPFGDYIKTALNVSKQQEFPLLDSLNEFIDKLSIRAGAHIGTANELAALKKQIKDPVTGLMVDPWVYADKISKNAGLGMPYAEAVGGPIDAYIQANRSFPKNVIRETFQKANMLLANFTLRLDFANSLINIISTAVMTGTEMQSIKSAIGNDSKLAGALLELKSVKVPGQTVSVPSTFKLIYNASKNFYGADKRALTTRYTDIGAIKTVLTTYHDMLDDLAFDSVLSPAKWTDKVNTQVDKMAKYTANNFSEEYTRFISADVMRQLTDPLVVAGKLTVKDQNSYINVFVNRVQGNYVTSQRPVVFQGTTGAAVSLFQTYAFNVLQQLYRHVENRDMKTLAVFGGLQSTVFGFNGLPFFDAVNTHLIGSQVSGNTYHGDAYSVLPAFNKELGDWMLYGTASAFPLFSGTAPALYSRGDINPRHITVIPVLPTDVPAVQASIKLIGTLTEMGKTVANGVDITDSLLSGLEHQGISRPLAGFAQLLAGRSTTSQGALISAHNDLAMTSKLGALSERVLSIEGVSRIAGARPMDEAVALNNLYRNKSYDALDKQRLESLGRTVRTAMRSGEAPTEDQLSTFLGSYAAAGGRQENFSAAMQRWQRDASVSVINRTAANLSSNSNRRMQELLGGYTAPDLTNQASDPNQP